MTEIKNVFRPEFLNRVDEIIVFHKLNETDILSISRLMLKQVSKRLAERDIHLLYDENVIAHLSDKGYDEQLGARPLRRVIQRTVEDQLSEQLLMGSISLGDTVRIRVEGDQLVYEREEHKNTETVLESNETKA